MLMLHCRTDSSALHLLAIFFLTIQNQSNTGDPLQSNHFHRYQETAVRSQSSLIIVSASSHSVGPIYSPDAVPSRSILRDEWKFKRNDDRADDYGHLG